MTSIEWARNADGSQGKTWNPIRAYRMVDGKRMRGWHCEHVHEGCKWCYAERQNLSGARGGTKLAYKPGNRAALEIELHEPTLLQPLSWRKPTTIFPCSMTDLFGAWVTAQMLDRVFAIAALCPQHTFIVLTKRPGRMRDYFNFPSVQERIAREGVSIVGSLTLQRADTRGYVRGPDHGQPEERLYRPTLTAWPLPNVWLLVSCSEQKDADAFVPDLLMTPATVRGVSLEPLLGAIDLTALRYRDEDCEIRYNALTAEAWVENSDSASAYSNECDGVTKLNWVIAGGESGAKARPMHPDWVRSLRDQCAAADVPFFFKQWGEFHPSDAHDPDEVAACDRTPEAIHVDGAREYRPAEQARLIWRVPGWAGMCRLGKTKAGRELDGVLHDAMPERRA